MASANHRRVTVITNGNYFASLALAPLLNLAGDDLQLQILVTTGLRRQHGNRLQEAWSLLRRWGPRYFCYKLATYAIPAAAEALRRGPRSVRSAGRARGLDVSVVRNVNQLAVRRRIEAFAPDLLLSISCPYRLKSPVLELARIGCLNLHSSLLPAYAGVCTYIHVLARGEDETGMTLHEMVEQFDAGRILAQQRCSIRSGMSVCELFRELCEAAGSMVSDQVLATLERGVIAGDDQDSDRRSYFGEPTRADVRALRQRGFALMTAHDARTLWSQVPGANKS